MCVFVYIFVILLLNYQTLKKMKFLIVFGFVAAVGAMPYHGLVNTGASAVQRHDDVCFLLSL